MSDQKSFKYELSVVVCAFNEEEHLSGCLESLKNQSLEKSLFEIIIVDNESQDRTPSIAKSFVEKNRGAMNVRYFKIKHVGLSISRNTGISLAQGRVICFIDGDAKVDCENIAKMLVPFSVNQETSIVCGRVKNLDNGVRFSKFIFHAHYESGIKARGRDLLGSLVGANMAFHRRVFEATGGFFDGFQLYGDESSVASKYLFLNPNAVVQKAEGAFVFNEHPKFLSEWLRQRFFQGRMLFLVNKHILEAGAVKLFVKAGVKFISCLFLAVILLWPVTALPKEILLLSICCFIGSLGPRYRYLSSSYTEVAGSFGRVGGAAGIATCIIGNVCGDLGFLSESWAGLRGKKIALTNSVSTVLEAS